jgi:hypothetical protein
MGAKKARNTNDIASMRKSFFSVEGKPSSALRNEVKKTFYRKVLT